MDFELDSDQRGIVEAVRSIFSRHAGPARARTLGDGHDDDLLEALGGAGFLNLWADPLAGGLIASLLVEEGARHLSCANLGIRALVAPVVFGRDAPQKVGVTRIDRHGPIRYGQHADVVLLLDGADVAIADVTGAETVSSLYGFPYANIDWSREQAVIRGRGPVLANWWRISLACEIVGALDAAHAITVQHLRTRVQFGRPLASMQALQHRLADSHTMIEGARWLARRAAFTGGNEDAASAAAFAAQVAQLVGTDMHQLCGAIGFTREFDLQLWTSRLHGLRLELGGVTNHQLAVAQARWG
jgi:alkylation response protein AidB-like acyl-CoA dehydrogenase